MSDAPPLPQPSRRSFLATSAAAAAAATLPLRAFHPGGRAEIKVGLIGCGGRGTGAAVNCIQSSPEVKIWALADAFENRLREARNSLSGYADKVDLSDDRCFSGLDAYESLLRTDVDLVILATPPGFRPLHLAAAVAAGKHVFAEKPVAVDPVGVRKVLAAGEQAKAKGLAIVAGTQRRHEKSYLSVIERLRDGAVGEVLGGSCYWNQGGLWVHDRQPSYSDVEWQMRNWLYFTWLSGDHIVEQHVHNLDVMNWVIGAPPIRALALGGRQCRVQENCGHIFDHFAVEYEYASGARVTSFCRQIEGTKGRVGEFVVGTRGTSDPGRWIKGIERYDHDSRGAVSPYVQEHTDLIASIRNGKPLNEARTVAEATMTAIMGRMSAYTGQVVDWSWAMEQSTLDLMPANLSFGDLPVPPVARPGVTPLV